jgi:HEAT repeat protein
LGNWGPQETALPALLKLLADPDADVRSRAAAVLGNWGQQETALPALLKLLVDPDADVRFRAAAVLGNWGQKETALLTLVELLVNSDAEVRSRAAGVLGNWGQKEPAVTEVVLKKLAEKADSAVVALLQQSGPPAPKHVSGEVRATLAALLQPQNNDSSEVKELRGILHGWVWRTLATTAS